MATETNIWARFFNGNGTENVVASMNRAYSHLKEVARQRAIEQFAERERNCISSGERYTAAISVHNGEKSLKGGLMNELVAYGYHHLFAPWEVSRELKLRLNGKRDIDLVIHLPKGGLYVSATTIPRERKDSTWKEECELVAQRQQQQKDPKPFYFVGLMGEYDNGATIEQTKNAVKSKQRLLTGRTGKITALVYPEHHAEVLSDIMRTLI